MLLLTPPPRHQPATNHTAADRATSDEDADDDQRTSDEERDRDLAKVLRTLDLLQHGLTRDSLSALTSLPLLGITADRLVLLQALYPGPRAQDDDDELESSENDGRDAEPDAPEAAGVAGAAAAVHAPDAVADPTAVAASPFLTVDTCPAITRRLLLSTA
jgi:hypothetical protein